MAGSLQRKSLITSRKERIERRGFDIAIGPHAVIHLRLELTDCP